MKSTFNSTFSLALVRFVYIAVPAIIATGMATAVAPLVA